MKTKLILTLLALIGFSGCSKNSEPFNPFDPPCMYGVPETQFRVIGSVVNQQGEPLKNIVIRAEQDSKGLAMGITDKNGSFTLNYLAPTSLPASQKFTFSDQDGVANGEYETLTQEVGEGEFAQKSEDVYTLPAISLTEVSKKP